MRGYVAIVPLLLVASSAIAQTNRLTLSCSGIMKIDSNPAAPANVGIVVNLTAKTISGFTTTAKINALSDTNISFEGRDTYGGDGPFSTVSGTMDRITGKVIAFEEIHGYNNVNGTFTWGLKCVPTKRIF